MTILGVSNSFTGPAEALEITGNHCYAYSGIVTSAGDPQTSATDTTLKFTTGNFLSDIILSWGNEQTSGTADNFVLVKMNGTAIYKLLYATGSDSNETNPKNLHLVIPSYTEFEVLIGTSGNPIDWTVVLTGRIYR